ncbi:MAG: hypothetical protein ACREDW_06520 [Aestuariivirgaceae bacterium]
MVGRAIKAWDVGGFGRGFGFAWSGAAATTGTGFAGFTVFRLALADATAFCCAAFRFCTEAAARLRVALAVAFGFEAFFAQAILIIAQKFLAFFAPNA